MEQFFFSSLHSISAAINCGILPWHLKISSEVGRRWEEKRNDSLVEIGITQAVLALLIRDRSVWQGMWPSLKLSWVTSPMARHHFSFSFAQCLRASSNYLLAAPVPFVSNFDLPKVNEEEIPLRKGVRRRRQRMGYHISQSHPMASLSMCLSQLHLDVRNLSPDAYNTIALSVIDTFLIETNISQVYFFGRLLCSALVVLLLLWVILSLIALMLKRR